MRRGRFFALERWRDIVIPEKGCSTRQDYCKWDAGPKKPCPYLALLLARVAV